MRFTNTRVSRHICMRDVIFLKQRPTDKATNLKKYLLLFLIVRASFINPFVGVTLIRIII